MNKLALIAVILIAAVCISCGVRILDRTELPADTEPLPEDPAEPEPEEPDEEPPPEEEPEEIPEMTILIYMSGDNNLEDQAAADLDEIEKAAIQPEQITILILSDRRFPGSTELLLKTPDGLETVRNAPFCPPGTELNLGSSIVLREFLRYGRETFPAEEYGLILWGHGSGIRPAGVTGGEKTYCPDVAARGDGLDIPEISRALAGIGPDLIVFDASYAGMIETAYELRNISRVMAGPEGRMPEEGIPYGEYFSRLSGSGEISAESAGVLAGEVCLERYGSYPGFAYGVFDLAVIDELAVRFNELAGLLYSICAEPDARDRIRTVLFRRTAGFYEIPGDLNLDIKHLCSLLAEEFPEIKPKTDELLRVLDRALLFGGAHHEMPGPLGLLSVHLVPLDPSGFPARHYPEYFRNFPVEIPMAFVSDSEWVPCYPEGPGFLYRIWYE